MSSNVSRVSASRSRHVGIVWNEHEARLVHQLRYRVYVHEQDIRLDGVDGARREMADSLDPCSLLWYVREGETVVGTITQTMIGADFDLSRLPSALELDGFPRSDSRPLGFSSRFAIAPDYRSTWVLPSLVRSCYEYGRRRGAKFDFMVTSPSLVPLFERLGYVRYTASATLVSGVGLLIPLVLPATDHEHLRRVRSACLPAASRFQPEPEWGEWLRARHPIIDEYYGSDRGREQCAAALAYRLDLPMPVAVELSAMSFVHHFPADTTLRREGDRVTYTFFAVDGHLSVNRMGGWGDTTAGRAPDGVAFSDVAVRCETDAVVLCVPDAAVVRLARRYPEYGGVLQELLEHDRPAFVETALLLR